MSHVPPSPSSLRLRPRRQFYDMDDIDDDDKHVCRPDVHELDTPTARRGRAGASRPSPATLARERARVDAYLCALQHLLASALHAHATCLHAHTAMTTTTTTIDDDDKDTAALATTPRTVPRRRHDAPPSSMWSAHDTTPTATAQTTPRRRQPLAWARDAGVHARLAICGALQQHRAHWQHDMQRAYTT